MSAPELSPTELATAERFGFDTSPLVEITAGEIAHAHIGFVATMRLASGVTVTDTIEDVFHSSRYVDGGFSVNDRVIEPLTMVRFRNTRPAPDWRLSPPKNFEWLTEFFEVKHGTSVTVDLDSGTPRRESSSTSNDTNAYKGDTRG